MVDRLLYQKTNIPIPVIQRKVSEVCKVPLELMLMRDSRRGAKKGSRKRERVNARQLSMVLCKELNKATLAVIGQQHGGREHATVLHAEKAINNILDTGDPFAENYDKARKEIDKWSLAFGTPKVSSEQLKIWIRHRVPLEIRQKLMNNICLKCGKKL